MANSVLARRFVTTIRRDTLQKPYPTAAEPHELFFGAAESFLPRERKMNHVGYLPENHWENN